MHLVIAVIITLAALVHPLPLWAHAASPTPTLNPWLSPTAPPSVLAESTPTPVIGSAPRLPEAMLTYSPAFSTLGTMEIEAARVRRAPSLSRHLRLGAGIGAAAGAALGLWVVSFADCAGSNCTGQRVVGVAGNALGGAAIGALIGGAVYLIRR